MVVNVTLPTPDLEKAVKAAEEKLAGLRTKKDDLHAKAAALKDQIGPLQRDVDTANAVLAERRRQGVDETETVALDSIGSE